MATPEFEFTIHYHRPAGIYYKNGVETEQQICTAAQPAPSQDVVLEYSHNDIDLYSIGMNGKNTLERAVCRNCGGEYEIETYAGEEDGRANDRPN